MNIKIKQISDEDLITLCNEICNWRNTGLLNKDSLFLKSYKTLEDEYHSPRELEFEFLKEAHIRFSNLVKLLFSDNPNLYLK